MLLEHELILNDFISADNFNLDGLIVVSFDYKRYLIKQIELSRQPFSDYISISSFLDDSNQLSAFCFIDLRIANTINAEVGVKLFRKIRGKTKIVFFITTQNSLENSDFFKYINWMRLVSLL